VAAPSAGGWSITFQEPATDLGLNGRPVSGMRVHFKTSSGIDGQVFVANTQYSAPAVAAAVADKAAQIEAVQRLKG
jgi:hypothetical protein